MGVTTKDLARICGVSRATVTRALHGTGSIKEDTKQKILEIAKEMGYQPDLMARSLVKGKSGMIGVVVVDLRNQYFPQIIDAIEKKTREAGFLLNISLHEDDKQEEKRLLQALSGYRADGFILNNINKDEKFHEFLEQLGIPFVILGYKALEHCYTVGVDEYEAAYRATNFILEKGYRELVFVVPPLYDAEGETNTGHDHRRRGFIDAAQKAGCRYTVIFGENYIEQGIDYLKNMAKVKPAFFCSGDVFAGKLISSFSEYGYLAPNDYGIMGYDKVPFYQEFNIRLATVDNHGEEMGKKAAEMLMDLIEEREIPKDYKIPVTLVDGRTL